MAISSASVLLRCSGKRSAECVYRGIQLRPRLAQKQCGWAAQPQLEWARWAYRGWDRARPEWRNPGFGLASCRRRPCSPGGRCGDCAPATTTSHQTAQYYHILFLLAALRLGRKVTGTSCTGCLLRIITACNTAVGIVSRSDSAHLAMIIVLL